MSKLEKFNQTLTEFNQEVEQLKGVSKAYKKLEQLVATYNKIIETFDVNSKELKEIGTLQKIEQEKIIKSLLEHKDIHKQNKIEIAKLIEEKIEQVKKENKEFYKEFESTVKIKLNDNKSEIKHLIENERSLIKQIFEIELSKNTTNLNQKIEGQTLLLSKNQKIIKILVVVLASINIVLCFLSVYKLWIV